MDRVWNDTTRAGIAWGITALNVGGLTVAAIAVTGEYSAEVTGEWYDLLSLEAEETDDNADSTDESKEEDE